MKKNKMIYLTVAVIVTLCTTLAVVQHSAARPGGHPKGPDPFMRCIKQLNLSSETRTKVDALMQAQMETIKADRDTMKAAMDSYFEALTAAESDSAALAQAQQAIIALEKEHVESRFTLESSIVALLSTDEVTQLGLCLISSPEPPADHSNVDNDKESN